jgi:uncharacterized membrane protein AbrB (regulator of aidB expression)
MAGLLLIHAVAAVGGLAGKRLRVPAGALVGSMLFVAALNIITGTGISYTRSDGINVISLASLGA